MMQPLSVRKAVQFPLKQLSSGSSTTYYDGSHTPLTELKSNHDSEPGVAPTATTQSNTTESSFMDSPTDNLVYLSLLHNINEAILFSILQQEHIIYDSLMRVYSRYLKDYIDIAGILTKRCLYFTSAVKYRIWEEFRERTKIDHIVNVQHHNQCMKIDKDIALQLIHNLDLIDDDTMIKKKMLPLIIGKTKLELKLSIILHRNNITSIANLFGIHSDKIVTNDMRYVYIGGAQRRNELIDYILMDIPWINEDILDGNSMVITLQKYFPNYLIEILNDKQTEYFVEHKESKYDTVKIERYDGYNIDYVQFMQSEIKYIDLNVFNTIYFDEMQDIGYGFVMKQNGKSMILFNVTTNNMRCEWIAHIDYAINGEIKLDNHAIKAGKYQKIEDRKDKFVNDFRNSDVTNRKQQTQYTRYRHHHQIGECLDYWQKNSENFVEPTYKTLKNELLSNKIKKLPANEYYLLYEESWKLQKLRGFRHKACDLSVNKNKLYGVGKGKEITINHIISLKLYTDYGAIREHFVAQCHKLHFNETLKEMVSRNREIANWCRYLAESVLFYGTQSKKKMYLYTVLKHKVQFNSMWLRIECPLSTTSDSAICQRLCESQSDGIVLQFKGNHHDTRFMNCWWTKEEKEERLIMGTTLKITGIWMSASWHKKYVAALLMFEQIISGHFMVNWKVETESYLYQLVIKYLQFDEECNKIRQPPQYFEQLFEFMISRMKRENWMKMLWINRNELRQIKHEKLRCLLCECSDFFDACGIKTDSFCNVQQFVWDVKDAKYRELCALAPRQYIKSSEFSYLLNDDHAIKFHLKCFRRFCDEYPYKCAIYLHLNCGDKNIEAIRVEYDMICDYGKIYKYQRLMAPQWLHVHGDKDKECGFETFSTKILETAAFVKWIIGIKVINVLYVKNSERKSDEMSIKSLALALQNSDEDRVLKMFNQLIEERESKNKQLERIRGGLYHIKQKSNELHESFQHHEKGETFEKRFRELMALSTRLSRKIYAENEEDEDDDCTAPTLTIKRSYSREINENCAAAVASLSNKYQQYEEEEKANILLSRSATFKSEKTGSWKAGCNNYLRADILNMNNKRYSSLSSISPSTSNTSLLNNAGSVCHDKNILYTNYSATSGTNTVTMSSWDKVTLDLDKKERHNIYNLLAGGYINNTDEDSFWDLSNSEYIVNGADNLSESTFDQKTPQPRDKMNSADSNLSKSLPSGWSTTYTASGMLVYLDHVNEVATFQHPLNDSWRGSQRSLAATFDSNDQKGLFI